MKFDALSMIKGSLLNVDSTMYFTQGALPAVLFNPIRDSSILQPKSLKSNSQRSCFKLHSNYLIEVHFFLN